MTPPVTVSYRLVSQGDLPPWAALALLALGLTLGAWLLRAELRTRGSARRPLLFVTRLLLLGSVALLVAQPVLFIRREERRAAALLIVADRSRSMLRTDPWPATAQLDIAEASRHPAAAGRETAPRDLAARLANAQRELAAAWAPLERLCDTLSQGLPGDAALLAEIRDHFATAAREVEHTPELAARLRRRPAATGPDTPPGDGASAGTDRVLDALGAAADACLRLQAEYGPGHPPPAELAAASQIRARLAETQALVAGVGPRLTALQEAGDVEHLARVAPATREALAALARESRFQLAARLVQAAAADPGLRARHRIRLLGWDPLAPGDALPYTDLFAPLEDALHACATETVSGVVLVTDGQQNRRDRPEVLRWLRSRNVPFLAVGAGRVETAPDVAVADWVTPGTVLAGAKGSLDLLLKTQAPPDTVVEVTLADGAAPLAAARITCTDAPLTTVSLPFRAPAEGARLLRLQVRLDQPDAEPANDEARLPLLVLPRRASVLLVSRAPRWDIVALLQALARRPCRTDTVFWGQPAAEAAEARSAADGAPTPLDLRLPKDAAGWRRYTCVILDGPPWPGFDAAAADLLGQYVAEGGTLLLCPAGQAWDGTAPFVPWLPTVPGERPRPAGLLPPPEALALPAVALSADPSRSLRAWQDLAPVRQATGVPPQAARLLTAAPAAGSGETAADARSGSPVFSVGFHGRGKVYCLGVADLFRLREWSGSPALERFLGTVVDELLRPVFPTNEASLGLEPPAPTAEEPATLLFHGAERPPDATIAVADAPPLAVPWSPAGTGVWAGHFRCPRPGPFTVRLPGLPDTAFESVPPVSAESIEFRLDAQSLAHLAEAAGGRYVPLPELPAALAGLPALEDLQVSVRDVRLWNLRLWLPVVAALVAADWLLRRRSGMPL